MGFDATRGASKVTRFVYWEHPRFPKSILGAPYLFLEPGFFKLVNHHWTIGFVFLQLAYFYGVFLFLTKQQLGLWVLGLSILLWGGLGNIMGVHRMWAHRAFRARFPIRVLLMIGQSISYMWSILEWSRVHRTHHKYSDTDADLHNVKRGFWFSHMGWIMKKEHPLVAIKMAQLDLSDIESDPLVKFNSKYITQVHIIFALVLPMAVGVFLLQEPLLDTFIIVYWVRTYHSWHGTAFVNSAAHMFGDKPYNRKIASAENSFVSIYAGGEGYHNYHHTYPWDYGTGELGNKLNLGKLVIDICYKFGQTYNLKQATPEMVANAKARNAAHEHETIEHEF